MYYLLTKVRQCSQWKTACYFVINLIISNHTLKSVIKAAVIGTDFACTITAVIGILFYGLTDCDCNNYILLYLNYLLQLSF